MEHFDSCATRLNSVSEVCAIARQMIDREFSWFNHRDRLVVEGSLLDVRMLYVCAKKSSSDQSTFIDCRLHFDSRQMWIGSLQVATCHRLQGVGRQMVRGAEATANALGILEVAILPRISSIEFWLKLDYAPDPRTARVLRKNLADLAENQTSHNANWLCTSSSSAQTVLGITHK